MFLGDVRDDEREQRLDCVFLRGFELIGVEVVRNVSRFLLVVERSESLQKVAVLFEAIFRHLFVSQLFAQITQNFPPVSVNRVNAYLFNDKILQKTFAS